MPLTQKNYFSASNTAISNSKVKDFLIGKEYYYHKHVVCDLIEPPTEALIIGSILDKIAQQGTLTHFRRLYQTPVKKSDNAERFAKQKSKNDKYILTRRQYDMIEGMAQKLLASPWYKGYGENTNKQVPLEMNIDSVSLGYPLNGVNIDSSFNVCGLLDYLTIDGDVAYIDDLKTAPNDALYSTTSWFQQCKRFDYFRQMAVYRQLVLANYPNIKQVVCRHAVIGKENYHPTKLFIIPDELLAEPLNEFIEVAKQIVMTTDWVEQLPSWESAEILDKDLNIL